MNILPVVGTGNSAQWGTATLLQKAEYYMCRAEHFLVDKPVEWWGEAWGWIRSKLDWLWDGTGKMWQGVKNIGSEVWQGVKNTASALHDEAQKLYNWMAEKLGVLGTWAGVAAGVLLFGGIAGSIWLIAEVLDHGGVQYGNLKVGGAHRKSLR